MKREIAEEEQKRVAKRAKLKEAARDDRITAKAAFAEVGQDAGAKG